MGFDRKLLVQSAVKESLKVRMDHGFGLEKPLCVFDLCEKLGISVWFADIPTMEGLYLPDAQPRPAVVVSSLRPPGRQAMTCGHELGHHRFGHGEQWDELVEARDEARKFQSEEFLVDVFSASLHMPKLAVSKAVALRGIDLRSCTPQTIYLLSKWFGVGYTTFILHASRTLGILEESRATELAKHRPKIIRDQILGNDCAGDIIVVDQHWAERPIDVQMGDCVVTPQGTVVENLSVELIEDSNSRKVFKVTSPGIGRIYNKALNWASFVRTSRKNYVGRAPYRFDKEVSDED